jgi:hypothetical protein
MSVPYAQLVHHEIEPADYARRVRALSLSRGIESCDQLSSDTTDRTLRRLELQAREVEIRDAYSRAVRDVQFTQLRYWLSFARVLIESLLAVGIITYVALFGTPDIPTRSLTAALSDHFILMLTFACMISALLLPWLSARSERLLSRAHRAVLDAEPIRPINIGALLASHVVRPRGWTYRYLLSRSRLWLVALAVATISMLGVSFLSANRLLATPKVNHAAAFIPSNHQLPHPTRAGRRRTQNHQVARAHDAHNVPDRQNAHTARPERHMTRGSSTRTREESLRIASGKP